MLKQHFSLRVARHYCDRAKLDDNPHHYKKQCDEVVLSSDVQRISVNYIPYMGDRRRHICIE